MKRKHRSSGNWIARNWKQNGSRVEWRVNRKLGEFVLRPFNKRFNIILVYRHHINNLLFFHFQHLYAKVKLTETFIFVTLSNWWLIETSVKTITFYLHYLHFPTTNYNSHFIRNYAKVVLCFPDCMSSMSLRPWNFAYLEILHSYQIFATILNRYYRNNTLFKFNNIY